MAGKKDGGHREESREAAIRWYAEWKANSNDTFTPLLWDKHRYLVLKGGGGSGKSIFAGRKVLERVTTEPGHRWLVVRKVAKTLRQSCFPQLWSQANSYYAWAQPRRNLSDMVITFANGSQILFAGLDDPEKLKSIFDITGIWIEEASELEKGDFNQLDIRLRTIFAYYLQIILTFNPISVKHWLKERFFDRRDPDATVHESTYKDNRFLPPENIKVLEGFRETDPYYYMVYALNQWGVTGKTVFDAMAIQRRLEEIKKPLAEGEFVYDYDKVNDAEGGREGGLGHGLVIRNIRFVESIGGPVKIYQWPAAEKPYVIGGDTAGEGSDWFVGQCLDNVTGKQAAVLRHQTDEDIYARQMYCLGTWYNTALLAVETNFSTFPVKELQRLGYKNLFVREKEDDYRGGYQTAYGFRTDAITRPIILANLIQAMRGHYDTIEDEETLLEMLTFVREPKKLRMEAEPGAHDDTVMALAIAHYARPQQAMAVAEKEAPRVKWRDDQWEDYRNADEAGRAYLIAKWGNPL